MTIMYSSLQSKNGSVAKVKHNYKYSENSKNTQTTYLIRPSRIS